jgi:hypothetical protein
MPGSMLNTMDICKLETESTQVKLLAIMKLYLSVIQLVISTVPSNKKKGSSGKSHNIPILLSVDSWLDRNRAPDLKATNPDWSASYIVV